MPLSRLTETTNSFLNTPLTPIPMCSLSTVQRLLIARHEGDTVSGVSWF
jgi:hypothetical protein